MKHISRYYKRLHVRNLKIAVLAVFVSIFFLPVYVGFQHTGDNMFTVLLNGTEVGVVGSPAEAEQYALEARKQIARDSKELVLVESEIETIGNEVLFGQTDSKEEVVAHMAMVLADDVRQTMNRCYVVKINDIMINLSSKEEVLTVLQAALDKYNTDKQGSYVAELFLDPARELPVLTANAISNEEVQEQELAQEAVSVNAGFDAEMEAIFESVEPDVEKDFEDYDLGLISMNFGDTIEVVEAYLSDEELTEVGDAIEIVTKDQEKNEVYEVVSGDTLSGISLKTDIPLDRLIEMNDTLDDENSMIRAGDELVIMVPKPELTVERQEELYYEEDYEADIIYVDNDDWYTTETKTLQEPSAGHRKVVAVVSFENDKKVSEEIIKEEITYEAVPKIVERGTKIPPSYIKPISGGRLSSTFGKRSAPKKGASTYHKGVDWATPTGTAVVASSGGVVAKAGWGSGYGYVVYINHPDGRQTRYGHLSKVLVSAGQTVSQGQKISLSGNTGISTGPHLHFEILINGSQVNPLKYLN